jgi:ketosteroid isomerase-like protein
MVNTVERNDIRFEGIHSLCPDVEIDVSELPGGRILRGREAVRAYWQSLRTDVWQDLSMDVETITERDEVVVALVRFDGVGRGSGVQVTMTAAWVVTVRDGGVASARLTLDGGPVLQAAGASVA